MTSTTLYTLTVDVEEEWDWSAGFPINNLSVQNIGLLPRFQEVCSRYGAAVTYFTNYAVLADVTARNTLLGLAGWPRVEIGMHIHPWNTPPLAHLDPVAPRETFLHNLPSDLALAKLESVHTLFAECGLSPTSFRGGRYSSGEVIQDFLRDKGFVADASVLPFSTWDVDGAPDYRDRDLSPRRLSPRQPGESALWEIPLTLAYSRRPFGLWHKAFETAARSPLRHLRLIGIADRTALVRKVWLNFEDPLGRHMLPFLRQIRRQRLPHVCFTVHSSSLMVGGNGYTRTPADQERVFAQIEEVLRTFSTWDDFRPATITEVATSLEEHHAHSRN